MWLVLLGIVIGIVMTFIVIIKSIANEMGMTISELVEYLEELNGKDEE